MKYPHLSPIILCSDDLSVQIAREFASLFNFAGIRVDVALRIFLSHVHITGEAGNRPQLLSHFARRYNECNPTVFNSFDEIHALTCALLILNNDLHEMVTN
jgi:Sec7-like guanine-nucleotide exchange factor